MRSVAVQRLWKLEPIINYENETMGENGEQLKSPHLRGFAAWMEACCKNTFLFILLSIHVRCFSLTPSVFFIWALPEIMTAAHWASSAATTGAHFWQLVSGFIQQLFLGGRRAAFKMKLRIWLLNQFAFKTTCLFNYLPRVVFRNKNTMKTKFQDFNCHNKENLVFDDC